MVTLRVRSSCRVNPRKGFSSLDVILSALCGPRITDAFTYLAVPKGCKEKFGVRKNSLYHDTGS